ncbi:hypothetical protein BJY04DRAFT_215087 [Aspergillus karnatakaensis]|uniref:uncharacterized protein n=1 Tax=Aspergillus karnatakaensis TaxID=1810916 RepID=UPI003CCCA42C
MSTSATSIYNVPPAEPILAHTLLQPSTPATSQENPPLNSSSTWNLKPDIDDGLHSPPPNTFHAGTILGFSRLRGQSSDGNEDELAGDLPRYLLTKWLRNPQPAPSSSTSTPESPKPDSVNIRKSAYIIHPPTSTIFAPTKLLSSLLSHQPPPSRNKAISHLDAVQLFPVFDFEGVVQAVNEISNRLHNHTPSEADSDNQHQHPTQTQTQTVLIITGLDTLTEAVVRSSNAIRGAAVLSSLLRTLTSLSRTHSSTLSILLVNTGGVGPSLYAQNQNQNNTQTHAQFQPPQMNPDLDPGRSSSGGGGVQSMFNATDTPLFPSLLMKTMDQGIDTHFLVSRVRGGVVVEVVKERGGEGAGRWCAWREKD